MLIRAPDPRRGNGGEGGPPPGRRDAPEERSVRGDGAGPRPLRVAVLSSARAPGLGALLERSARPDAPYRIVTCVSSDPACREVEVLHGRGVPLRVLDIHRFYEARNAPIADRSVRAEYDRWILEVAGAAGAEALLMCGYLYVVTEVLLDAFPDRVLNIHHADLTLTGTDGRPRYRGLRAVREAILAGEPETRSTVHLATPEVDAGPLLVRSGPFFVHPLAGEALGWRRADVVKAYAYAHREWMMESCWGGLLDRALELLAGGRVRVEGGRALVDGAPGPEAAAAVTGVGHRATAAVELSRAGEGP